jgi:hypothetical protein
MARIRTRLSPAEHAQVRHDRIAEASALARDGRYDDADRLLVHTVHEGWTAVELFFEIVDQAVTDRGTR